MRTFIISLMLLWTTTVLAEEFDPQMREIEIPMTCFNNTYFLKGLNERYGEKLVFSSISANHLNEPLTHQFWMNPESQTWTFLVENYQRKSICILGSGQGFANIQQGDQT
jgi:hypothetical protein